MGNSKYLDSLSLEEYKSLTRKLWTIQNHRCFICGEEIDLDLNPTNIDHIKPLVTGGKDDSQILLWPMKTAISQSRMRIWSLHGQWQDCKKSLKVPRKSMRHLP